jgi:hypothetical protein
MDRFLAAGELPNFARFRREAEIYTTESDEVAPNLEPWIQWITVHSGIPYRDHKIQDLGDGYRLGEKNLWDLLSDAGHRVWVCGSMNIQYQRPIEGWILPDPWMTKVSPYPEALAPYHRFVQANVTEYTAKRVPLTPLDALRFAKFMATHGLSLQTVSAIIAQLASERVQKSRWKRAAILDKLQMDLFSWYFRTAAPSFSTFFINSTAHYQHLYWRNMEPEQFKIKPTAEEQSRYERAILFGYKEMDLLLGRFIELAGRDSTLVFATALSQQPCLTYEERGGKTLYRPHDFDRFLKEIGIESKVMVAPVMAEQFHIDFSSETEAAAGEAKLKALRYGQRGEAMAARREGTKVFSGCRVFEPVGSDARITFANSDRTVRFFDLFYRVDLVKSGMHHPDGMLWIRTPGRNHLVKSEKVPLISVAPTILEMFGVDGPASMKGTPIARSSRRSQAA